MLLDHGVANRIYREVWLNPSPMYKEALGIPDYKYDVLFKEANRHKKQS